MKSVIFVHRGNDYYLQIAISQAHKYNPNLAIILLGDSSNANIKDAKHYLIEDYFTRAAAFDKHYVNHSPNSRAYELFCFQRWFIIDDFLSKHPEYETTFLYCDSDTLLYADVTPDLNNLGNNKVAVEAWESPGFTFFAKDMLKEFCDMVEWAYTSKRGQDIINRHAAYLKSSNATQGISDMTAFRYFCLKRNRGRCIDAMEPTYGWDKEYSKQLFCYDHNLNYHDNCLTDRLGGKVIKWQNKLPYCYSMALKQYVLMKGIHYQGHAKPLMVRYGCCHFYPWTKGWLKCYIQRPLKLLKKRVKTVL